MIHVDIKMKNRKMYFGRSRHRVTLTDDDIGKFSPSWLMYDNFYKLYKKKKHLLHVFYQLAPPPHFFTQSLQALEVEPTVTYTKLPVACVTEFTLCDGIYFYIKTESRTHCIQTTC